MDDETISEIPFEEFLFPAVALFVDLRDIAKIRCVDLRNRIPRLGQELTDELFSAADVVVLPYRNVWQSAVLFQAFSYARSVLASALGGFIETIREGKTGYLFPAGDRNALAQRLVELSRDRPALEVVGRQARDGARRDNNWDQIARMTLEVYRSAR